MCFPSISIIERSAAYLSKYVKDFPEYLPMVGELRHAFEYFDATRKLPLIMVDSRGSYVVEGEIPKVEKPEPPKKIIKLRKVFNEELLPKLVDKLPVYPGGNEKFQAFIEDVSKDMSRYLLHDQQRAYIMLEFIIDEQGKPGYSRVIKGGNEDLNEKLEDLFDKMQPWNPAIRLEKAVPVKLKQSIVVEKK